MKPENCNDPEIKPWLAEYLKQEFKLFQDGVESSFKVFLPIANSNNFICKICQPIRDIILNRNRQDNWVTHTNGKLHSNQLEKAGKWNQYELDDFKLFMNAGPLDGKFRKQKADQKEILLQRRQKQIDDGKKSVAYQHYIAQVPKLKRGRYSPSTPDKSNTSISRQQFDYCINAWEHQVNEWYQREINFNKEYSRIAENSTNDTKKSPSKLGWAEKKLGSIQDD